MNSPHDLKRAFGRELSARCDAALRELCAAVPDVSTAMVATVDGFELASTASGDRANSRLAALSSSLLAVAQASMREMRLTGASTVLVENQDGKVLVVEALTEPLPTVLCVGAGRSAVTGKLLWAVKQCVDSITRL